MRGAVDRLEGVRSIGEGGQSLGRSIDLLRFNCLGRVSSGFWGLGSGFRVPGSGFWVLGSGFWVLGGSGLGIPGSGFWVLGGSGL